MVFGTERKYGLHDCNFGMEYCREPLIAQPPVTKMQRQAGFRLDDRDMTTLSSFSNSKGSWPCKVPPGCNVDWHKRQAMTEQPEKPKSKLDISS